jgi:hypothetical protein
MNSSNHHVCFTPKSGHWPKLCSVQ